MKYHCRLQSNVVVRERQKIQFFFLFKHSCIGCNTTTIFTAFICVSFLLQIGFCTFGLRAFIERRKKNSNSDKMERNQLIWSLMASKRDKRRTSISLFRLEKSSWVQRNHEFLARFLRIRIRKFLSQEIFKSFFESWKVKTTFRALFSPPSHVRKLFRRRCFQLARIT